MYVHVHVRAYLRMSTGLYVYTNTFKSCFGELTSTFMTTGPWICIPACKHVAYVRIFSEFLHELQVFCMHSNPVSDEKIAAACLSWILICMCMHISICIYVICIYIYIYTHTYTYTYISDVIH